MYFGKQQRDLGKLNGYIEEMMGGQKVVKVFCHEEKALEEFRELNEKLRDSANNANAYANILMPVNAQLGNVSYVLCAVVGAILAIGSGSGVVTVGTLVAFLQLNKSFNMPITQVSQQLNSVVMAMAGAERIFNLLDEQPETDEGTVTLVNVKEDAQGKLVECKERTEEWAWKTVDKETGKLKLVKLEGDVEFKGVDFGYTDEKIVLHDIKMFATPGQKLAFVGSTGAGKTTITNLINRFYDIQDGKICYDGININKIKKADLRRSLGIVLQDTHLFTGTVMENIRYGKLDATDEECIRAAKLIFADKCISKLKNGYYHELEERGDGLSAGEKQMISFARIVLKNPSIVILDEATSSIDTETENLIQKALEVLLKDKTAFIVAHRLSTIRNADRILYIADKGIAEEGNHKELMEKKGLYYRLNCAI